MNHNNIIRLFDLNDLKIKWCEAKHLEHYSKDEMINIMPFTGRCDYHDKPVYDGDYIKMMDYGTTYEVVKTKTGYGARCLFAPYNIIDLDIIKRPFVVTGNFWEC